MEEAGPAGVDSTLIFENSDNMMELPIIKYDQKQVWKTRNKKVQISLAPGLFCDCHCKAGHHRPDHINFLWGLRGSFECQVVLWLARVTKQIFPFYVNELLFCWTNTYIASQVSATMLWDSSIHDSVFLNRVTQSHERVYLILKVSSLKTCRTTSKREFEGSKKLESRTDLAILPSLTLLAGKRFH